MIEFTENTYCLGIWYLQDETRDWLAAVTREGEFVARYRFRYYRDDKAWDSDDVKNWWEARCPGKTEDQIIAMIDDVAAALRRQGFSTSEPWRRIVRGNSEAVLEALKQAPFSHIRQTEVD